MTGYRQTALTMQYLFGIYEFLMGRGGGHIKQKSVLAALDAGFKAIQASKKDKDFIASSVMAELLRKHPDVAEAVFTDPEALAASKGQGLPSAMDEYRRATIIEGLLRSFIQAPMTALKHGQISQETFNLIMQYAKDIVLKQEGVRLEEFQEVGAPFIQEIYERGGPSPKISM